MKSMALIPARGGSKGILRKNLIPFCGLPLLAWTIKQAKEVFGMVVVDTDDDDISLCAEEFGASVHVRPLELGTDSARIEGVVEKCIRDVGIDDRIICLLQCTSPLRTHEHIRNAVGKVTERGYDSCVSVVKDNNIRVWGRENGSAPMPFGHSSTVRRPRQERPDNFIENGAIYVFKACHVLSGQTICGGSMSLYEMPHWTRYEIDEPDDVGVVEGMFKRKGLQ